VRVSQAYFDVLAAQDTLTFVQAQKAAVNEQLASAKRNFEVGTSTITDTREAQARYDLVIAQEIAAENDLRVKKLALDQLVGKRHPAAPAGPAGAAARVQPDDVAAWVQQATDQHPACAGPDRGAGHRAPGNRQGPAGHRPTLDLQASYNIARATPTAPSTTRRACSAHQQRQRGRGSSTCRCLPALRCKTASRKPWRWKTRPRPTWKPPAATWPGHAQRLLWRAVGPGPGQGTGGAEQSSQSALDANKLGYQVGVRINIDVLNAQSQLFQTKRDLAQARYNVLLGTSSCARHWRGATLHCGCIH
jgi:outer membrane protein